MSGETGRKEMQLNTSQAVEDSYYQQNSTTQHGITAGMMLHQTKLYNIKFYQLVN